MSRAALLHDRRDFERERSRHVFYDLGTRPLLRRAVRAASLASMEALPEVNEICRSLACAWADAWCRQQRAQSPAVRHRLRMQVERLKFTYGFLSEVRDQREALRAHRDAIMANAREAIR